MHLGNYRRTTNPPEANSELFDSSSPDAQMGQLWLCKLQPSGRPDPRPPLQRSRDRNRICPSWGSLFLPCVWVIFTWLDLESPSNLRNWQKSGYVEAESSLGKWRNRRLIPPRCEAVRWGQCEWVTLWTPQSAKRGKLWERTSRGLLVLGPDPLRPDVHHLSLSLLCPGRVFPPNHPRSLPWCVSTLFPLRSC